VSVGDQLGLTNVTCSLKAVHFWHLNVLPYCTTRRTWRKNRNGKFQAHALKGKCMNVGDESLSKLCMKAKQGFRADKEEKQKLLNNTCREFTRVQDAIKTAI